MNKKIVKLLSLVLVVALICPMFSVMAADIHTDCDLTATDTPLQPMYEITCISGKHKMQSSGVGRAYTTSGTKAIEGFCYQCSKCYLVMVSELDPYFNHAHGDYCFKQEYESINAVSWNIYNATIYNCSTDRRTSSFWQGFEFYKGT